jgi:hypothetical protein
MHLVLAYRSISFLLGLNVLFMASSGAIGKECNAKIIC